MTNRGVRTMRIEERYRRLAQETGIDTAGEPDARLWAVATSETDAELHQEALCISATLWASELAPEIGELQEAVRSGEVVDTTTASRLHERFVEARRRLYIAKLAATKQDICRVCSQMKPEAEVRLVLIYIVSVSHSSTTDELAHFQEFAYACAECREDEPPRAENLRQADGTSVVGEVFKTVFGAVEVFGSGLWVCLGNDSYDRCVGDYSQQPGRNKTEPPMLLPGLTEALGVPPDLYVTGTNDEAKVVIQVTGYTVDLIALDDCSVV